MFSGMRQYGSHCACVGFVGPLTASSLQKSCTSYTSNLTGSSLEDLWGKPVKQKPKVRSSNSSSSKRTSSVVV